MPDPVDTIKIRYEGEDALTDTDGHQTRPARAPWPKGQYVLVKDFMSGGDIRRIARLAKDKMESEGIDAESSDAGIYQGVATCAVMIRGWSGHVIRGAQMTDFTEAELPHRFDLLLDDMPVPTMAFVTMQIAELAQGPFVTSPNGTATKTASEPS